MFAEVITKFKLDNHVEVSHFPPVPVSGVEDWTVYFTIEMLDGYVARAYLGMRQSDIRRLRPAAIMKSTILQGIAGQEADGEPLEAGLAGRLRDFAESVTDEAIYGLRQACYDVAADKLRRAFYENDDANLDIHQIEKALATEVGASVCLYSPGVPA